MADILKSKKAGRVFYVGSREEVEHFATPQREHHSVIVCDPEQLACIVRPGDVCVFYNEFFTKFRECCLYVKSRGCATIYAIDGILEWRNLWDFPSDSGSCLWTMRPVLADKVACIGRSQARILESWGNLGKCEVVGIPRFDVLRDRAPRIRGREPFTLLIMTAKNPGFNEEQRGIALRSLAELKSWIDSHNLQSEDKIRPLWRVTAGLDKKIGVPNNLRETTGEDLASLLQQVDAVVTTPSTAILESMLYGLPVALLDFTNSPQYVSAAWSITAREHFDQVIPQLITFPQSRRLLQAALLQDHLEFRTEATIRMATLIDEMLLIAAQCQKAGVTNEFPQRILMDGKIPDPLLRETFDLKRLFPGHFGSANTNVMELQAEISHLRLELDRKSKQLEPFEALISYLNTNLITRTALKLMRKLKTRFYRA